MIRNASIKYSKVKDIRRIWNHYVRYFLHIPMRERGVTNSHERETTSGQYINVHLHQKCLNMTVNILQTHKYQFHKSLSTCTTPISYTAPASLRPKRPNLSPLSVSHHLHHNPFFGTLIKTCRNKGGGEGLPNFPNSLML